MWLERLYDVVNPAHYPFGSLTTVTPNANRQMSRSFDLLKTFWIWPMLSDLNLDNPWTLSTFLRLVDLGSFLDSTALVGHVQRTCLARGHLPPPQIMLDANHGYVIPLVVVFLHGIEYESIHAGTLFTKYVVQLPQFSSQLYRTYTSFLGTFLITKFQLNSRYYAEFWSLLQVHISWRQPTTGVDHSMERPFHVAGSLRMCINLTGCKIRPQTLACIGIW